MDIKRADLLRLLESVSPGLATREVFEQSSCFVFQDKMIITYNDQVACWVESPFDADFTGAVQADSLTALLRKLPDEVIKIEIEGGLLMVRAKNKRAEIRMEAEVVLPIGSVEKPPEERWKELDEHFCEAIGIVQSCAGTDAGSFQLVCVHIHPEWVEACDNFQMCRFPISTGVKRPVLVRRDSVKHITGLAMTEFAETKTWIHFRNPQGLSLACRRFIEEFPDLTQYVQAEGVQTTLPGGLAEAVARAEVFSAANAESPNVKIALDNGSLVVSGEGTHGKYSEKKKVVYEGKPISFMIAPKLLTEVASKHNACQLTSKFLKVDTGKFVYVTSLVVPKQKTEE